MSGEHSRPVGGQTLQLVERPHHLVQFWRTPEVKGQRDQLVVADIEVTETRDLEQKMRELRELVFREVDLREAATRPFVSIFLCVVGLLEIRETSDVVGGDIQHLEPTQLEQLRGQPAEGVSTQVDGS